MPTGYRLRFVPYTPGGARILTPKPYIPALSASIDTPYSDTAMISSLQVSAKVYGALPTYLEVGAEVFNPTAGTWQELRSCRFLMNTSKVDDTDATQVQTLTGMGIWDWFLQKCYMAPVTPYSVTGVNSISVYDTTGVSSSGSTFTLNSHQFTNGDQVRITNKNGAKNLQNGGVYWVQNATTNTFQLAGSFTGTPRSVGSHTGIALSRLRNRVTKTGHQFVTGEKVTVTTVGGASGITAGQQYYIVNVTANTFGLASQVAGQPIHMGTVSGMALKAAADGDRRFNAKTPGFILKTIIDEAQARGALTGALTNPLAYDFTAANDSNGIPWANTFSLGIPPGTNGLAALQILTKNNWVEYATDGRTLHAYNTGSGTNRSTGTTPVTIGSKASTRPVTSSLDNMVTNIVTVDDNGKELAAFQSFGPMPLGILEQYQTQAGNPDAGTSAAIVNNSGTRNTVPQQQYAVTEAAAAAAALPCVDYFNGDIIRVRFGGTPIPLAVVDIQYQVDETGQTTISTTLGYRFLDLTLRLARNFGSLTGGRKDSGTGKTTIPFVSAVKPGAPSAVAASSSGVYTGTGNPVSSAALSWSPVSDDGAGNAVNVVDYEVYIRPDGADDPVLVGRTNGQLTLNIPGLPANSFSYASVAAVSASGQVGVASAEVEMTTVPPTDVLDTPTLPILSSSNVGVTLTWDGNLVSAAGGTELPPPQFAFVVPQFASSSGGTFADVSQDLSAAGEFVVTGLTVGATYWFRLVAVDVLGNQSAPTAAVSVTVQPVVGTQMSVGDFAELTFDGGFENPTNDPIITAFYAGIQDPPYGVFTFDTSTKHSGSQALKFALANGHGWLFAVTNASQNPATIKPLRDGSILAYSWWDRVDQTLSAAPAQLQFTFYNAALGTIGSPVLSTAGVDTINTWTNHSGQVTAPAGTVYFAAAFVDGVNNTGSRNIWFDDLTIKQMVPGTLNVNGTIPATALTPAVQAQLAQVGARGTIVDFGKLAFAAPATISSTALQSIGGTVTFPALSYATSVDLSFLGQYAANSASLRHVNFSWSKTDTGGTSTLTVDFSGQGPGANSGSIDQVMAGNTGDLAIPAGVSVIVQLTGQVDTTAATAIKAGAWRWTRKVS